MWSAPCPRSSISAQRLVGIDDAFIQFGKSPPQCVVEEFLHVDVGTRVTLAALLHGLIAFRSPKTGYVRIRFHENEVNTPPPPPLSRDLAKLPNVCVNAGDALLPMYGRDDSGKACTERRHHSLRLALSRRVSLSRPVSRAVPGPSGPACHLVVCPIGGVAHQSQGKHLPEALLRRQEGLATETSHLGD